MTQVRGYADQLLRVKTNPYDPSNRRISILVKNEAAVVPALGNIKVVDGKPAPAKAEAAKEVKAGTPEQAKTAGSDSHEPAKDSEKAPEATATAKPKPAAGKPGFMTRIKQMIPGLRK